MVFKQNWLYCYGNENFDLLNQSHSHPYHLDRAMAYALQLLGYIFSLVISYVLPAPFTLSFPFFFTLKWPGGTQIISCPKEPDLDIWAENLGHTTHQPNLVLKLSHFRRHISSHIRDFLSTQIFKKMIFELTIRGPKVVSQAHGLHCTALGWQWPPESPVKVKIQVTVQ